MKLTHKVLAEWLQEGNVAAQANLKTTPPWPHDQSSQSEWTAFAHFTLACALRKIYPLTSNAMSLRVSETKLAPTLWPRAVTEGIVNDWSDQQMGLDFTLLGPTGSRVHYLSAESECRKTDSVSISLTSRGYIWDWKKLLATMSEHRLFIAVVQGRARRDDLICNMQTFFKGTFTPPNGHIWMPRGVGGYILASEQGQRGDSRTFVVNSRGALEFRPIRPSLF